MNLAEAQAAREEILLNEEIDRRLDVLLSAKTVGPHARAKLRHLLAYYASKPHPFRACVRDNMKRFGPGRTEAVCATLKDIIRGTTHWRKGGHKMHASGVEIDEEVETLLMSISSEDLEKIVMEANYVS